MTADVVMSDVLSTLRTVPAHRIILTGSEYFKAQIQRWQKGRSSRTRVTRSSKNSSIQQQLQKPMLPLVLQHPSHEPAAMAVLAALYGVSEIHLLPQEQQLQAALLADMWRIPGAASKAVELLVTSVKEGGLSEAAAAALLELGIIPDFLLPVFSAAVASGGVNALPPATLKRLLLHVLGDLEAAWAEASLQAVLMGLPLPAMVVLLGCDELQVASEDTVLFTAQSYVDALPESEQQHAKEQLAPLIRCPHLSWFWLSALAYSDDAPNLLLSERQADVHKLMMVMHARPNSKLAADLDELLELLPDAPSSWTLPERCYRPVSSVQLTWRLDMDTVRAIVARVGPELNYSYGVSPATTAPMGGLTFKAELEAEWDDEKQGAKIGMNAKPQNVPKGAFYSYSLKLSVLDGPEARNTTPVLASNSHWGKPQCE